MSGPLESKVAVPAVVGGALVGLSVALYKAVLAFGLFHPTPAQTAALLGLGAALLYLVQVVAGYLAPHTPRPTASMDYPGRHAVVAVTQSDVAGTMASDSPSGAALPFAQQKAVQ